MKMLIDSQWVDREKKIPVRDPYNESIIDYVPRASRKDALLVLDAAERGFETSRSTLRQLLVRARKQSGRPEKKFPGASTL